MTAAIAARPDAWSGWGRADQDSLAVSKHSVIGGVPRHREPLGDPSERQMLDHQGD